MSDTCIVCLGDLGEGVNEDIAVAEALPRPADKSDAIFESVQQPTERSINVDSEIAHLLPCGHHLHNECLKPWVERANSCPICRQSFNVVELTFKIGGPVLSSYVVEDRVQVAEIDPSMIIDELIDADSQPCPVCGEDDNEDVLLLCDGCETASHTYCVGLDSVPSGPWYCVHCEYERAALSEPPQSRTRRRRRTRGDQRRTHSRNEMHAFHWARVWQSVWDQLNLDLDFPFDDGESTDLIVQQRQQEAANRREFRAWERRFRVAERQGGANRFRETAPALLEMRRGWPSRPRPRIETPEPESLDEVRAWNAFERARDIEEGSSSNRRKRKSPTASPIEPEQHQPERKLKRPRTKRPEALADILDHGGEASKSGPSTTNCQSRTLVHNTPASGPSFLQSLLKEVEESSPPNWTNGSYRSIPPSTAADMSSSGPSSPANSPLSQSRSSSRPSSTTPPPRNNGSAFGSCGSDADFSSPEFSPSHSPAHTPDLESKEQTRISRSRRALFTTRHNNTSPSPSRFRSNDSSPTRPGLSLSIKSDLQKMVRAALKPYYRKRQVSKEQYTDINRTISRMLYDHAGASDRLDSEGKSKLATLARDEVENAIATLRELRTTEASDSSGGGSTI